MEQIFNANNPYSAKILGEPTLKPAALAKSMQFQLPGPSEQSANELSGNQYADVTSENVDKGGLASLKEIFTEMAYDIQSIARNTLDTADFLSKMIPSARDKGIDDADKEDGPPAAEDEKKGMFGLEVPEVGPKVGLALMLLGLTALFKYSDQIAAAIEFVLPYIDKFLEIIGPTGTLYLGLAGLAALIFPKTFKALLGVGKKSILFAFDVLKKGFMLMRTFLMTTAPNALKNAYTGGKGLVLKAFTTLAKAFKAMRLFMLKSLVPKLTGIFALGPKALIVKAVAALAAGFTALKVFLLGTLIPAITAIAAPFIVPIEIIAAVVAGAVAAFYSIKAGIDEFKKSLDEGDSMLVAIIEGVSTALLTLVTLPITLIKNFVAWVAKKLGFEGIAEKLKEFSIVDFIKDGIKNLVMKAKDFVLGLFDLDFKQVLGKFVDIGAAIGRVLKGIALGSIAAVKAAFPGGESPMEAFSRVYDEVSNKDNDSPSLPDEAPKADTTDIQSIENAKEEIKENEAEIELIRAVKSQDNEEEFTGTNTKISALQSRNAELLSMIYENSLIQSDIAKKSLELQGTNSGGTVVTTINTTDASQTNQSTSNTTQTPGLAVDGSDSTARMLALQLYGSSNF